MVRSSARVDSDASIRTVLKVSSASAGSTGSSLSSSIELEGLVLDGGRIPGMDLSEVMLSVAVFSLVVCWVAASVLVGTVVVVDVEIWMLVDEVIIEYILVVNCVEFVVNVN